MTKILTFLKWSPLLATAGDHLVAKNLKHWLVNIFSLIMFLFQINLLSVLLWMEIV